MDPSLFGTRRGSMMGTPDYVAPEQIADAAGVDIRADIYSLGAVWYFMLTGEAPYSEEKTAARKIAPRQTATSIGTASLRRVIVAA
jgi:serine/threonine protein kinase